MSFPGDLYLLIASGACAATFFSLPFWREWSRRTGLMDEPGARKQHRGAMPLAGGIAILTGVIVPLLAFAVILPFGLLPVETSEKIRYGFSHRGGQLIA